MGKQTPPPATPRPQVPGNPGPQPKPGQPVPIRTPKPGRTR